MLTALVPSWLRSRALRPILALFAATFLVYGVTLSHGFIDHDDDQHISRNPRMQVLTAAELASYWTAPFLGLYIPVTYTYWSAGAALSHLAESDDEVPWAQPGLFHCGNLVLHALNGCLIYYLLRRYAFAVAPALAGALLFIVHPIQVEAVAWASGAKDLLSTFLALLALVQYSRFTAGKDHAESIGAKRWQHYATAFLLFCLAMLAKPSTVTLPLLFGMQEIYARGRLHLASLLYTLPHYLAVAFLLAATGASQGVEGPFVSVALWLRPLVAGDAMLFYLRQIFLPLAFAVDYARRPELLLADPLRLSLAVLPYIAGALLLWCYVKGRLRILGAALLLFFCCLLPTLGFREFAYSFFSTVCDRYAYLAMTAAALLAAAALSRQPLLERSKQWLGAGLVLLALSVTSLRLAMTWENEATLFGHSVEVEPNGAVALVAVTNDLGNHGRWQETVPLLQRASVAMPTWGRPYNNLGTTYLHLGQPEHAERLYRQSLLYYPNYALAHNNLCAALREQKKFTAAEAECNIAIGMASEFDLPHLNLGFIADERQDLAAAEMHFQRSTDLNPQSFNGRRNLAKVQKKAGNCQAAARNLKLLQTDYPTNLSVILDLAQCQESLGQKDAAKATYRAFLSQPNLDPSATAAVTAALSKLAP